MSSKPPARCIKSLWINNIWSPVATRVARERALIKFRNGTHQLLLATDLAARGLDIPEIKFIIHFNNGDTDNENADLLKKDGKWFIKI